MNSKAKELLESVFSSYLKQKGLKFTPERLGILGAIIGFQGHFNADNLFAALQKQGSKISRATVYRTIPLFQQSGIIRETIRSGGKASYENCFDNEHHDHLLCVKCGKLIEFKVDEIEQLQEQLCRQYQFKPVDHWLSIRGYCRQCRGK